jgi:YidC/Oxa1 family membrane protein insertase
MENIRFALLVAIGVLCFFLYQAWNNDHTHQPAQNQAAHGQAKTPRHAGGQTPGHGVPAVSEANRPPQHAGHQAHAKPSPKAPSPVRRHSHKRHANMVRVVTDKLNVVISTRGGTLREVELRGVPASSNKPHSNLYLLNDSLPDFFIAQSGLIGGSGPAPNHHAQYHSAQNEYHLPPGQKTLRVPLTWTNDRGHKVTKVYTFTRGSYRIGLAYNVTNKAEQPWSLSQYVRFWRTPHHQSSNNIPFSGTFFGVGWYQAKNGDASYQYQTKAADDLAGSPLSLTQTGGWAAMIQHYFIGAVIPPAHTKVRLFAHPKPFAGHPKAFATGFVSAKKRIATGTSAKLTSTLFVGPKLQNQLNATAPGLDLTVNYGWFTVLAKPIFWVLSHLHEAVGNWGVAIILLTCLIKALFYKLSEIQYRGMARMRKFQPRMQQLKEQYGDDRAKLQAKMMELYKKEGFNPLAGCWPMLVQMPVFIALYWVLRESPELRFAPFVLWIQNLAAPDPYYILPIIFGATMFIQQRLMTSVTTMDPMQQRMMQIMPIGMAVFFAFFPAGLVLYYCVNNILSMTQQWYIYRKLDAEGLGHKSTQHHK